MKNLKVEWGVSRRGCVVGARCDGSYEGGETSWSEYVIGLYVIVGIGRFRGRSSLWPRR